MLFLYFYSGFLYFHNGLWLRYSGFQCCAIGLLQGLLMIFSVDIPYVATVTACSAVAVTCRVLVDPCTATVHSCTVPLDSNTASGDSCAVVLNYLLLQCITGFSPLDSGIILWCDFLAKYLCVTPYQIVVAALQRCLATDRMLDTHIWGVGPIGYDAGWGAPPSFEPLSAGVHRSSREWIISVSL